MQCFNLPSEDKYGKTYEQAGKLILEVTHGKRAAALDFVRRVILAYVTGNDDLHLKNISVQRLPDNTLHYYDKLSPNYDCLFCDAFKADDAGMSLLALGLLHDPQDGDEHFTGMYQHYGYYTGYDFLELGRRLGLPEKPIRSFISKLQDQQRNMTELIKHSYMPDAMKARAGKLLASRIRVMQVTQSAVG